MFNKNDKILLKIKVGAAILTVVLELLFFVGVIIAFVEGTVTTIVSCVVMMIFTAIMYAVYQLIFSFYCDIKLIRNKLYGASNDNLSEFIGNDDIEITEDIQSGPSREMKSIDNITQTLVSLKKLLDGGGITEEEFTAEKKKVLSS